MNLALHHNHNPSRNPNANPTGCRASLLARATPRSLRCPTSSAMHSSKRASSSRPTGAPRRHQHHLSHLLRLAHHSHRPHLSNAVLTAAILTMSRAPLTRTKWTLASRTDKGVHAVFSHPNPSSSPSSNPSPNPNPSPTPSPSPSPSPSPNPNPNAVEVADRRHGAAAYDLERLQEVD